MTNLLINLSLFEHAARLLKKDFPSSSDAKQSPVEDLRERCCGFCWAVSPDERFSSAVLLSGLCGQQRVEVSSYSWETSLAVSLSLRPVSSSSRFHLFLLFSRQRADPAWADASSILICSLNVLNPFIPILNVTLCIYCRWAVEQIVES